MRNLLKEIIYVLKMVITPIESGGATFKKSRNLTQR